MKNKFNAKTVFPEIKLSEANLSLFLRLSVTIQFLYGAICLYLIGQEGNSLFDTQTIAMMVFLLSPVIIVHAINWIVQTCKWSHLAFIFGAVLQVFVGGIVLPSLKDYGDAEQAIFGALFLLFWFLVIHCLQDPQGEMDRFIKFCNTIRKVDRKWYLGALGVLISWALISAYLDEVGRKSQLRTWNSSDELDPVALEIKRDMEAEPAKSDGTIFSVDSPENEAWVRSITSSKDVTTDKVVTAPSESK